MQVHNRLQFDAEGRPMLYVFRTCRDFLRTLPSLQYSRVSLEDVDSDGEDHIADETRYLCMLVPMQTQSVREERTPLRLDPLNRSVPAYAGRMSQRE